MLIFNLIPKNAEANVVYRYDLGETFPSTPSYRLNRAPSVYLVKKVKKAYFFIS